MRICRGEPWLALRTLCMAVLLAFALSTPVYAADIAVDETCSLADAISAANADEAVGGCPAGDGADVIALSADIVLEAELPRITTEITVEGGGYSISGALAHRIFYVEASGTLGVEKLTMVNGRGGPEIEPDLWSGDAGAVYNDGRLTIIDCMFSKNMAGTSGAIVNRGTATIDGSVFVDNSDHFVAGAISNNRGGILIVRDTDFIRNRGYFAGAIGNHGKLHLVDSLFEENEAMIGGAIVNSEESHIHSSSFFSNFAHEGGAILNTGELSITDSQFSGNRAAQYGGAIKNKGGLAISRGLFARNRAGLGGAIDNDEDAVLEVDLSAFTENVAGAGGAIFSIGLLEVKSCAFSGNGARKEGGALFSDGMLSIFNSSLVGNFAAIGGGLYLPNFERRASESVSTLRHLTIVANSAEQGGGIHLNAIPKADDILHNSILADNAGGDCVGGLTHSESNLIQDGSCDAEFSGDPMLGDLVESEDGSPAYFPLLAGSPAIDAANSDFCPQADQIGTSRPQGDACDIGAIEFIPEN